MAIIKIAPDKKNMICEEFFDDLLTDDNDISKAEVIRKFSITSLNLYIPERKMELFFELPEGLDMEEIRSSFSQMIKNLFLN